MKTKFLWVVRKVYSGGRSRGEGKMLRIPIGKGRFKFSENDSTWFSATSDHCVIYGTSQGVAGHLRSDGTVEVVAELTIAASFKEKRKAEMATLQHPAL